MQYAMEEPDMDGMPPGLQQQQPGGFAAQPGGFSGAPNSFQGFPQEQQALGFGNGGQMSYQPAQMGFQQQVSSQVSDKLCVASRHCCGAEPKLDAQLAAHKLCTHLPRSCHDCTCMALAAAARWASRLPR